MEQEQIPVESVETETPASVEDSSYGGILAGEGADPQDSAQSVQQTAEEKLLGELIISEGQRIPLKTKEDLEKFIESNNGLFKDHLLRQKDYTLKTQAIAAQRKSYQEAFGRDLEADELKHLGTLFHKYGKDQRTQQIIDAILNDKLEEVLGAPQQNQAKQERNPLQEKVDALEAQLSKFTTSIQERERAKVEADSASTWNGWVEKRKASDKSFQVSEEVDQAMAYFIPAISQRHPDWDNSKVLDEAYRHATIDNIEKSVRDTVLKNADGAKRLNPPKITTRAPVKAEPEKSYKDIYLEEQG